MDNNKIMDYLYGEMSPKERVQFEAEMEKNDQLRNEVQSFKGVRSFLREHQDEAIPPTTMVVQKPARVVKFSGWWAVAASLLLLLAVGKMTDFRISAGDGQVVMGFGPLKIEKVDIAEEPSITLDQIQMVLAGFKDEIRMELDKQGELIAKSDKKITDQRGEMKKWMNEMQSDQGKFAQAFWNEYNRDKNLFTTQLVNDFIEYNETQRQGDMEMINKGFSDLAQMIQLNIDPAANLVYQTKQK